MAERNPLMHVKHHILVCCSLIVRGTNLIKIHSWLQKAALNRMEIAWTKSRHHTAWEECLDLKYHCAQERLRDNCIFCVIDKWETTAFFFPLLLSLGVHDQRPLKPTGVHLCKIWCDWVENSSLVPNSRNPSYHFSSFYHLTHSYLTLPSHLEVVLF